VIPVPSAQQKAKPLSSKTREQGRRNGKAWKKAGPRGDAKQPSFDENGVRLHGRGKASGCTIMGIDAYKFRIKLALNPTTDEVASAIKAAKEDSAADRACRRSLRSTTWRSSAPRRMPTVAPSRGCPPSVSRPRRLRRRPTRTCALWRRSRSATPCNPPVIHCNTEH
jgi:hypothetical protein